MATILDSLLVSLGYDFDDEGLKEFNESVDAVTDKIDALVIAAGVMATAFVGMTTASAIGDDAMAKQARVIGITAGEYDELAFAMEQTTGTSEGLGGSLESLSRNLGEAARGTGSALEAFSILGVSTTDSAGNVRDVNDVLLESADALNKLGNESQQLELADKLGLSNLTLLLRQGSQGIQRLRDEAKDLGTITEEDAKAAEEFNDQWNRLVRISRQLVREVSTKALPIFTEILETFQEWLEVNDEAVQSGLETFLNAVAFALRNIQLIMLSIISLKFAAFILKMALAFKALGASALIAQLKIFAIVVAIAAVIAAIALLIEDFIVFKEGGDSAIGRLIERFPELKKVIEVVGGAIEHLHRGFILLFELIEKGVTSIKVGFKLAQDEVSDMFTTIDEKYQKLKRIFEDVQKFLGNSAASTKDFFNDASSFLSGDNNLAITAAGSKSTLMRQQALGASITNTNRNTHIGSVSLVVDGGNLDQVRKVAQDVFNGNVEQASNNAQTVVVG